MNEIERIFGKKRVFLPVIHTTTVEQTKKSIRIALESDADGIFLIDQKMSAGEVLRLIEGLSREPVTLPWIGLNLLAMPSRRIMSILKNMQLPVRGVWKDDAADFINAKEDVQWEGLTFGGVAFKYQREVPNAALFSETRYWSSRVNVVTTSGDRTGQPPTVEKVSAMYRALEPPTSLALASGISPDNVQKFLPYAHAFLVASSIEKVFGVLDPVLTRELADKIHADTPFLDL